MKKLLRLMLIGLPFLAFSGVSLAADDNNISNFKILSASTSQKVKIHYIKPEGAAAQPVNIGENKIYEGTVKVHTEYQALDENHNIIYSWIGKHVHQQKPL